MTRAGTGVIGATGLVKLWPAALSRPPAAIPGLRLSLLPPSPAFVFAVAASSPCPPVSVVRISGSHVSIHTRPSSWRGRSISPDRGPPDPVSSFQSIPREQVPAALTARNPRAHPCTSQSTIHGRDRPPLIRSATHPTSLTLLTASQPSQGTPHPLLVPLLPRPSSTPSPTPARTLTATTSWTQFETPSPYAALPIRRRVLGLVGAKPNFLRESSSTVAVSLPIVLISTLSSLLGLFSSLPSSFFPTSLSPLSPTLARPAPPISKRSQSQDNMEKGKSSSRTKKKGSSHADVIDRLDFSGVGPSTCLSVVRRTFLP